MQFYIKLKLILFWINSYQWVRSSEVLIKSTEAEFKEFKSRLKSAKTRFKLSTGLNFETFDTILSETNHN